MERTEIYRKKLDDLDCFTPQEGVDTRTAEQLKELVDALFKGRRAYVFGTLEDRVLIGYYDGKGETGQWRPEQAELERILELRVFSEDEGELYLFRRGGRLSGRFLREDEAGSPVFRKTETNYVQTYMGSSQKSGGGMSLEGAVYDIVYYFDEDPRNGMLQCVDSRLKGIYKGEKHELL